MLYGFWFLVQGLGVVVHGGELGVQGSWFMVQGLGFWFMVEGCGVEGLWLRIEGFGVVVYSLWMRIEGLGMNPECSGSMRGMMKPTAFRNAASTCHHPHASVNLTTRTIQSTQPPARFSQLSLANCCYIFIYPYLSICLSIYLSVCICW